MAMKNGQVLWVQIDTLWWCHCCVVVLVSGNWVSIYYHLHMYWCDMQGILEQILICDYAWVGSDSSNINTIIYFSLKYSVGLYFEILIIICSYKFLVNFSENCFIMYSHCFSLIYQQLLEMFISVVTYTCSKFSLTLTVPNPLIWIRFCTHPRGLGLRKEN